ALDASSGGAGPAGGPGGRAAAPGVSLRSGPRGPPGGPGGPVRAGCHRRGDGQHRRPGRSRRADPGAPCRERDYFRVRDGDVHHRDDRRVGRGPRRLLRGGGKRHPRRRLQRAGRRHHHGEGTGEGDPVDSDPYRRRRRGRRVSDSSAHRRPERRLPAERPGPGDDPDPVGRPSRAHPDRWWRGDRGWDGHGDDPRRPGTGHRHQRQLLGQRQRPGRHRLRGGDRNRPAAGRPTFRGHPDPDHPRRRVLHARRHGGGRLAGPGGQRGGRGRGPRAERYAPLQPDRSGIHHQALRKPDRSVQVGRGPGGDRQPGRRRPGGEGDNHRPRRQRHDHRRQRDIRGRGGDDRVPGRCGRSGGDHRRCGPAVGGRGRGADRRRALRWRSGHRPGGHVGGRHRAAGHKHGHARRGLRGGRVGGGSGRVRDPRDRTFV
ncbi:uncharacterized protein METZ01_LOCUS159420, partial [marine metagenome]